MSDLQEYIRDAFQRKFKKEVCEVKVHDKIPHQYYVKVRVQNLRPEMTTLARAMEQEFAELDRHVDIQVAE